ncbi:hypothetical protein CCHOA_00095 [Corynebacterium choanae]|uniref:Uncharacterized protein n=1 Tax=Corynebacterium choanae TaxID=1862358 RepID=A0A3G6J3E0_9CORY|nr:hypothetical protein CCHOA_00095 [Corynebacterium choanae]
MMRLVLSCYVVVIAPALRLMLLGADELLHRIFLGFLSSIPTVFFIPTRFTRLGVLR